MTTQIKLIKSTFYKNVTDKGGALAVAIKNQPANTILIHSQTKKCGRLWGFSTPQVFLKNIEKNNGLYEVIHSFPHKLYFDIDGKNGDDFEGFIQKSKDTILSFFPDADIAISGSSLDNHNSLHITVNNYLIQTEQDRIYVKTVTKHICENVMDSFDWKVYTKNRNMKCINQSKLDARVQQIIENTDMKKHVITAFFNDTHLALPELPETLIEKIDIAKSSKTFDLSSLPKMILTCPDTIDYDTISPEQCIKLLPLNNSFNHDYTHLVARFCHTNDLSIDVFLSWYANKSTTQNDKWRTHFSNLHKFPPVSIDRMKTIMATFYPNIFKDINYRRFTQTFQLPAENIQMIETIDQSTFNNDNKYIVHNIGMGGGKTAQTIDFLQTEANFLWIAPNKALASNTKKRFEDKNISITHYLDVTTTQKVDGKLNDCNKLISVVNSLHYIDKKTYSVVIIDEIETLIDKFLGPFMEQGIKQKKKAIWDIFINIIRSADKVILLDAFITTKTINLIKSIEGSLDKVVIFKRISEPQTRTIHYHKYFEDTIHDAIQKIKSGHKVFIFYPYKNDSGKMFSMEKVYQMILEQTGKKGVFYNADVDDKIKNELKNVNESWADRNFVITNNILTCGVNYEMLDFDYKYLFIASFNVPRDIIQVSYRARYLSTGIIHVCYLGAMNQPDAWLDDCVKMNCPIYTKLYTDILIEKKAPLRRAFNLFCVKAHYRQIVDKKKMETKIQKEIDDLLLKQQCGYSFDGIEDINTGDSEFIQQKCLQQEATMYEKLQLQKFFYNKSFLEEGLLVKSNTIACVSLEDVDFTTHNISVIGEAWDKHYLFFFAQLKLMTPNNIFQQIADFNHTELFFFPDIKKMKLSPSILDQIFIEFKFRTINRSSSVPMILKTIYNTHFGKTIIQTIYSQNDKKKNDVDYEMAYYTQELYEFSNLYLKKPSDPLPVVVI